MILIALGLLLSLSCFALAAFIGICAGLAAGQREPGAVSTLTGKGGK